MHILRDGIISIIFVDNLAFWRIKWLKFDVIKHLFLYKNSEYGIFLRLIFVNFKVYAKISFQLLSSDSKIIRTFALGLLAFSFICHS